MGAYDLFYLDLECPKCGHAWSQWCQTKSLFCEYKEYRVDDPVDWPDTEIFVHDAYCDECDARIYQGIHIEDGFVKEKTVAFVKGELPNKIDKWIGELYFPSDIAAHLEDYRFLQKEKDSDVE